MSYAVKTIELSKHVGYFSPQKLLDSLNLEVSEGKIFGLLGPNGAGKTTTFKLLLGLFKITSGSATIFDKPVPSRESRKGVGYLPEVVSHYAHLSIAEYLDYYASLAGLVNIGDKRVDALSQVGMSGCESLKLGVCSKGMRQRVDLARLFMMDSRLILLDEPVSGLDPSGQVDLKNILLGLKSRGVTIILNSHAIGILNELCDDVAILSRGRVQTQGSLKSLLETGRYKIQVTGERIPDESYGGTIKNWRKVEPSLFEGFLKPTEKSSSRVIKRLSHLSGETPDDEIFALQEQGYRIYHVEKYSRSLEDLFIKETADPVSGDSPDSENLKGEMAIGEDEVSS